MSDIDSSTLQSPNERDFVFLTTLDEILGLLITHAERARDCGDERLMIVHMKIASRCLRCALEIFGDRLLGYQKEETK